MDVAALVQAWMADRDEADALLVRWGQLEAELWRKAGGGVEAKDLAARYPEAQEMLAIDTRLPTLFRRLDTGAQALAQTRSRSLGDVLGKLQVLHRLQGPDLDEPAATLLSGACEELWRMVSQTCPIPPSPARDGVPVLAPPCGGRRATKLKEE